MEDIVKTSAGGELQTICHHAYACQNLIRTIEPRSQLVVGANHQRSSMSMQEPKPYPIPSLKLQLAVFTIIVFLVQLLGLKKTITHVRKGLITVRKELIHCSNFANCTVIVTKRLRLTSINHCEQCP